MWLVDPLEWQYAMSLARSLLPELSYSRDIEAALAASRLGGLPLEALRRLDWSRPVIYMPPFEKLAEGSVVVAVEGFTARRLVAAGVKPDVVVTDLDFEPESAGLGSLAVVHAHGDNVERLQSAPPRRVFTVQVPPPPGTANVGGFTDGDRAAYLAYAMGAQEITVSGFYPDVPVKRRDSIKARKLALARALLARLSRRVPLRFL
ncbi:MAG: 6-hydroxymethylpterin diphosphokinase MptE-like protein [Thermoproteus sp.]